MDITNRAYGPKIDGIITTMSYSTFQPLAGFGTVITSNWPTANKAFYSTIYIPRRIVVTKMFWVNGTTLNGNFDMGVYDSVTLAKLCSMTAVSQTGFSGLPQVTTLTNPITLKPGEYLLGISGSGTGRILFAALSNAQNTTVQGAYEQTSAHPMPDPAVPVTQTATFMLPVLGLITDQCGLTA